LLRASRSEFQYSHWGRGCVRHPDGETQEDEAKLCESVLAAMDNPPAAPIAQPAAAPPADAVPLALGAP